MNHRFVDLAPAASPGQPLTLRFAVGATDADVSEFREIQTDAAIFALGGGSWPETGSDGTWIATLEALGIAVAPLQPTNCGWEVVWPESVLAQVEGQPLKTSSSGRTASKFRANCSSRNTDSKAARFINSAQSLRGMTEPELEHRFQTRVRRRTASSRNSAPSANARPIGSPKPASAGDCPTPRARSSPPPRRSPRPRLSRARQKTSESASPARAPSPKPSRPQAASAGTNSPRSHVPPHPRPLLRRRNDRLGSTHRRLPHPGVLRHRHAGGTGGAAALGGRV